MTKRDAASQPRSPGNPTLIVGLTGGIGSGKSTAANAFSALGVPVIDADQIARELVAPGQPALAEIVDRFGPDCLSADGQLNRDAMRQQIFSDPDQKSRLESILHPGVRLRIKELVAECRTAYCVVVIPLLLEAAQIDLVDRILVIDVPEKEQLKRVAARDGLSDNAVAAIMATQADRNTRLTAADDVIVNDQSISTLTERVRKLHRQYMDIAHEH